MISKSPLTTQSTLLKFFIFGFREDNLKEDGRVEGDEQSEINSENEFDVNLVHQLRYAVNGE